ncbi:hypothetical protein [Saccharicrinis carchari]|uniref:hypothetical protein n=1 Tax=Saccharicrinis carchari TaxID=1168039 RepID=UPI00163DD732|nr:hypothetical protein [Saccharicrinis carchari]
MEWRKGHGRFSGHLPLSNAKCCNAGDTAGGGGQETDASTSNASGITDIARG